MITKEVLMRIDLRMLSNLNTPEEITQGAESVNRMLDEPVSIKSVLSYREKLNHPANVEPSLFND